MPYNMTCGICDGRAYLVCSRDDGRKAVERCDACADGVLSDEQAAVLARHDGIACREVYPCYVLEPGTTPTDRALDAVHALRRD